MVVAWAWEAEHRGLYTVTECQFPKGKCLGIGCLQSDNGGEVGPGCYLVVTWLSCFMLCYDGVTIRLSLCGLSKWEVALGTPARVR